MSTKLTGYVWDGCAASGMKLSSVAIMARLADFSNDEGVCWPSIETIARQIGAGMSTVRTAIARLEAEGWLTRKARRQGKGEVSTACRGCKGKGIVLDEKRTRLHGTPVYKICGRCNGNRFSRLPTTLARHHVQKLVPDLTDYQWYKGYADVIDKLVTKCWQEEAYAETQLRKVTR